MQLRNGKIIEYTNVFDDLETWKNIELIHLIKNAKNTKNNLNVITILFKNIIEHKNLWRYTKYNKIFKETSLRLIKQAKIKIKYTYVDLEKYNNLIKILETLL
jgi:hypothetical protein